MAWNINYTKDNSKRMISKYQLGYLQKNYDMLDEGFRKSHPKEKLSSLTYNDAYKVMGEMMKKVQVEDVKTAGDRGSVEVPKEGQSIQEQLVALKEQLAALKEQLAKAQAENKELREKVGSIGPQESLESLEDLRKQLRPESEQVQSVAEEPVDEGKREPRFPVTSDFVVENWANPDAVYSGIKDSEARITDVGIRKPNRENELEHDNLCIRLENGHEIAMEVTYGWSRGGVASEIHFNDSNLLSLTANGKGAFTDEYVTQMVSDIREALVGEKYGQGKEKEILRAILGDDCKVGFGDRIIGEIIVSDCRHGTGGAIVHPRAYEGKNAYTELREAMVDVAELLKSNSDEIVTLKEMIEVDLDADKVLANVNSCKEVYDEIIRGIEERETNFCNETKDRYYHGSLGTPEAHEKALKEFCEKLESSRPGEAVKVDYTFTYYSSKYKMYREHESSYEVYKKANGYTNWMDETCKALQKLREDRVQSVMGDKELAAFGHGVRFHCKDERGADALISPIEVSSGWIQANDTRAAVLIQLGLVTKQEGQTLADYRPKIVSQDGKTTVEPMPMLSEEAKKLLASLVVNGRAITDLTPVEKGMLSRDFKEAAKNIEAEKSKLKQAKGELLADCQQAGKVFAHEGQNMTLEDVGKIYASKVEGKNGGLASFKKEAMEAIVAGYKEEKQKLADKQKGKDNSKPQDKQGKGGDCAGM